MKQKRYTVKKVNGLYKIYDSYKDNLCVKTYKTKTKVAAFLLINGQDGI